ncbi:beta-N-acetylhexosaminidase [Shewanella sp. NIFS-20-20]|uniref:beta-N-acetylhexosaminidase n=1 Tax=Shewanella sp. NIFS-20-20 TaxID=2853806 RepID=UPI001C445A53|nr:beta-N-acetylhexosaminidase [Shewanella sp. NIFS-20-20]MBV7315132.1 beta-N-acetylhexosaminidase [Shewanella sp. NIFS-20-20]
MSYLMMDLQGLALSPLEAEQLAHPAVGGLILFSRNYQDRSQLAQLIASVRRCRPEILIAVDQEGGRVQRFREGFTAIPAMGSVLRVAKDPQQACDWARELGFLMAIELVSIDIDLSFAPVLDLNGISEVIGSRSFSDDPAMVARLAESFIDGMQSAGMAAVGKHFPGHGSVAADSHIAMPVDERSADAIRAHDLIPFQSLMRKDKLQGVMPAHVIYPQVDKQPAGFSRIWLQQILKQELEFNGVIFSDDLGMKGATVAGDYRARVNAALTAGCDMALLCNDPAGVASVLDPEFLWPAFSQPSVATRLLANKAQVAIALEQDKRWHDAVAIAQHIVSNV